MNVFKKIYCRAFQFCFKAAIPILPYRKPELLHSVDEVPGIIKKEGSDKVLVVTDATLNKLGLLDNLYKALADNNIPYFVYDKTVANPTTDNVYEALSVYKANKCNALIGFGGGSSMDCAKAVGVLAARPNKTLDDLKGILKVHKKLPLLIAVPTTAGTGSETTLAAIIVDSKTRHKYCINDFPLIPRYAVMDARVTEGLPKGITSTTGMDALTHAVEAFIGGSTTKDTRKDSLYAVKLIFENLDKAVENGSDLEARKNMLVASFHAGCAFTKSYVGYVHAVAHSLGGKYNVPHGLANAVLLPFVLEEYGDCINKKLKKLSVAAGVSSEDTDEKTAAKAFIQAIKDMKIRYGIGDTFPELKEEDIDEMAAYADKEGNPLYPVPVLMDKNELKKFYHMVMEK
ncbi:MAG: iron-containing alcohol dehydrogenase [Lachnospiraceae bacterium]|nr:iron-containing alcohol dehydrogenase [Lachnospiraceae bacterium]